jgi:CubicO group peptidase (beta-lactamase class C family)
MIESVAERLEVDGQQLAVVGECAPGFRAVHDTFIENFLLRRELGASVCVWFEGSKVVDLWGGHMDPARTREWQADTIVSMASVVKGMLAFALHMLADRGLIDYDEPIARYWPEFAQAGKERITVRQLISHHAALHFTDHAAPGDFYRYERIVRAIEQQRPEWAPGTRGVYHTLTIVPILEELIRRVSGLHAWEFFRREVTDELDVDYHIRMSSPEVARFSTDCDTEHFFNGAALSPELFSRFFRSTGNPSTDLSDDERSSLPFLFSAGNARGAARLFAFAAMDGELDGKRVLSPRTIDLMTEVQWHEKCAVWGTPMRTALGLLVNDQEFFYVGPNPSAFGTAGAGGSFAMADRDNRLAVAYSLNRWWPALALGDRARALIDSAYRSL